MMTIEQKKENGIITLLLDGWLDHDSSPDLEAVISEITEASQLIIDFAKVEYISSAGIRALVAAHRKTKELDAGFSVINVNSEVMSILSMTGIHKKLDIRPSEE